MPEPPMMPRTDAVMTMLLPLAAKMPETGANEKARIAVRAFRNVVGRKDQWALAQIFFFTR